MEKQNEEKSTDAAESSQSQLVDDDDSKVGTFDSVLKAMEKQNEETSSTYAAETSQSQSVDDDSKVQTFDSVLKAMEKQNEEKSTDAAETSQSQLVDDDSKVETFDCVSKSMEKQIEEKSTDTAETSHSQSVDDDSKVNTFDCVLKAVEKQNEETSSTDAAETSQSQLVDDDSKVETFDCVSKSMEKQNLETSNYFDATDMYGYQPTHVAAQYGQTAFLCHVSKWNADADVPDNDGRCPLHCQLVDADDSKVETFDSVLKAMEKQNEEKSTDAAETSQSQSVDDDSTVQTFDSFLKAMEKQNEEKSTDAAETSRSQLVDDDSKVETFDCVSKSMGKQNEEKSTDTAETSHSQSVDDDSKVNTSDCVLKAMEKQNEEKSTDAAETSQNQSVDDDLKVDTFDCVLKAMEKQNEEKSTDAAETSQSQSVDDDSKVQTFDSFLKAMEKQNEEKSTDAAETSRSQLVDDDSKVETFDCVSKSMEKQNEEKSTDTAETSHSQSVDDDSKVNTSDCVLKAMEKQNEEKTTDAAETSQNQSVDDDSKVDTFDCVLKAMEKQNKEKSTDAAETSQSQSVDDDSKVDTFDCVLKAMEKQNEEKSIDAAETSQSQSVDDDSKVDTFDCVLKAMEKQNEETSTDAAETSQGQSVDEDSKVGTFDSVLKAMEKQNEETSTDAAETSQSQLVDDDLKVETFDSVLKAMEKQNEKTSTDAAETSQSQSVDDDSKVETFDSVLKAQGLKEEGNKLFQKRDYDGAMFKYGEAIKILPTDHVEVSHVRANMASCYMQLEPGEFAKAIHECDLALSVTPDYSKALLKRARCYEALNKLDLALKDVCMVSKLDPKNPMASEIADKLKRTLEGKGLTVKDSVIELPPDYVEPVEASPALWAKLRKTRVKKTKKSNQVQEKSEGDNVETKQKNNNNLAAGKGKEKIIDKQNKKKVNGKQQSEKRSDMSKEQEKVIIEEKLLDISGEDVNKAVKFVYSDDIRLSKVPINCTLFQLREVVHECFAGLRAVHIKYKDQEGDLVTITTDEELRMSEVSERSLNTMRFYVVEVSPEQDPFFGRLVEMKKLKITADSFKTKVNGKGACKLEDWMIEFARLFKIQAGVVSDTCLNLQELGMKLNSEAMEEVVTSDAAQGPFDKAAQQFQEVAARSLVKLGNVHMSGARKRLSLLRGVSGESGSEQLKNAYECVQKEHTKAKEKYKEAMKIKSDLFEVFLALGLQQFEEARLSWYYVLVSQLDLKTWPYSDVVQFYQCAESNIKMSMEVLKNLETKKESENFQAGKTDCLTHEKVPGSSTQDNLENEAGRLKSLVDVLLCAVLYERSIMEYKLDQPFWRESLEAAMEKFELAGTCRDDVVAIISEDYVAGNTLRDLRFHMEEILHIFNEIDEAKQWRNGIPSDQLEDILKRRTANIFHMSNTGIQRG